MGVDHHPCLTKKLRPVLLKLAEVVPGQFAVVGMRSVRSAGKGVYLDVNVPEVGDHDLTVGVNGPDAVAVRELHERARRALLALGARLDDGQEMWNGRLVHVIRVTLR